MRRSAQNFASNLSRQVSDVRGLVNFRRGLDKQAISFAKNPDNKMAADQIASSVLRDIAKDHTNTALPELAQVNNSYHNLAKAHDFTVAGSKVLSDMSQSGGGLYSRLVTGKTAQGVKSFTGAGMQRLGKMLGGAVPGEVAQSRAAQAVASLPEDHPALYVPGEPRVVSEQVPYNNALDVRPGARQQVDQATPRMINRTTPRDALNLRQNPQERVDTATPLNVRTPTLQGGAIGGMDNIVAADARPTAEAAQVAAQATPPPNSVDALAQPRTPSQSIPIDLRQSNVPMQIPNPGTPIDIRTQPMEQVPTQVPGNVPPVDLRGTPTREVQRVVPGEPVPVPPPPPAPPAQASPLARLGSLDVAQAGGDLGGNLPTGGQPTDIASQVNGGFQVGQQDQGQLGGSDMSGGSMDTSGGSGQDQSPYPLANLEADMSRDPKNSATYMSLYKMLNPNGNLSPTMQRDLANVQAAKNNVNQLSQAYDAAGGGEGRIGGAIANLIGRTGMGSKQQQDVAVYNSVRSAQVSKISRALGETGVLTDQDISRALGNIPSITDTPYEASRKLAILNSIIAGAEQSIRSRGAQTDTSSLVGVGQ